MPRLSIPKAQSLKPTYTLIGIVLLLMVVAIGLKTLQNASASVSGWKAGYIISDYVFTKKNTMSVSDIQSFLNTQVPNCDTWGAQPSEFGGGTRRQWAEAHGYSAPFTCLRNYSQGGKSAAQIIYNAAQDFNINPQVLLVLLQKEQGLVTDTWPLSIQYRSATGYGCPDNAACDSDYYGFNNQVRWAARMFHAIMTASPTWYTPYILGNNYIQYNPSSSCGGSTVNIQNRATQALYNYTPYQPNQGALNAGWGTASCGSYGNRNFYLYFVKWFGSTTTDMTFVYMNIPRWMQIKNDTQKIDPLTGEKLGDILTAGTQIKFSSKPNFDINGEECLRTKNDTLHSLRKCIPISDIEEIVLTPETITPTTKRITGDTLKRDILTEKWISNPQLRDMRQLTFTAKLTLGPDTYYITQHDADHDINQGVLSTDLASSVAYQNISPQYMELTGDTKKYIPSPSNQTGPAMPEGMRRFYTSRVQVGGQWYYRTETDTNAELDRAVPASSLQNVTYESFNIPRWMRLKQDTVKIAPLANGTTSDSLSHGQQIKFVSKVNVEGVWYYRSEADTTAGNDKGVPASILEEIPFERFLSPRELRLKQNAKKYIPAQESAIGTTFSTGLTRAFHSKMLINGQWYYRTEADTRNGFNTAFRASDLEEVN